MVYIVYNEKYIWRISAAYVDLAPRGEGLVESCHSNGAKGGEERTFLHRSGTNAGMSVVRLAELSIVVQVTASLGSAATATPKVETRH